MICFAFPATASAAECTNTYTGPAEGSWGTAANWSAAHVPNASDVACVASGKTVKDALAGSVASAVQVEGALILTAGSLELTGAAGGSTVKTFAMSGGSLQGPGSLTVTSSLTWSSGQMSGAGTTVVGPTASATLTPTGRLYLKERLLVNEGAFTLASGELDENASATVENHGTFTVNSEHAPAMEAGTGTPRLVNTGTFRKTVGTGVTSIAVPFENSGAAKAETGTLRFAAGGSGSGGSWEASEGDLISFYGGAYSISGATFSGKAAVLGGTSAGQLKLEEIEGKSAELEVTGGILQGNGGESTFGTLRVTQGTVSGTGTIALAKSLIWVGGEISGSGSLVISPSASGSLTASGRVYLKERRLVNEGNFTLASGEIYENASAKIENNGLFLANSEHAPAIGDGTGSNRIVNRGNFMKAAGTGTTTVSPSFENYGSFSENTGHLAISHPISKASSSHTGHNCKQGDPVECATGDLTEIQTDLAIGGRGIGLELTRAYSAQAATKAGTPGPFGYGWSGSFGDRLVSEEEGAKVTLSQADGGAISFTKSGSSWSAPTWSQYRLVGNTETGFTLTLPAQTTYGFSGSGRLLDVSDRYGNETTLAYDGAGRLATVTDPGGRPLTFTYNLGGQVESIEDPMGKVVKYAYEANNLVSVTMPGETSPRWQFKYDASHRITQLANGRAGKTTNEYDSSSRVVSQTDPAGRTLTFKYEPFHTTITNKATGAVTDEWFNSNNQPFSVTHGFGTVDATTQTFGYDEAGRLLRATDGNGHTTTFGYDAEGNRTSEHDPLGHETKWTYNGTHDLISTTTPRGETTTIKRDAKGNVESISRPAPGEETQTTIFAHDEHGQLESLTDPLGRTWSYGYDSYGNRTSETDPLGHEQTTGYDGDSRVVAITSPRGNLEGAEPANYTTAVERDAQGRPLKVTDPLGQATKYAYDGNGNLASVIDAKTHTTKYTYNADDERTKVEKPNGATLQTAYDGAGYISSQTDGNGKTTTYVRNVLEQPVEVLDPLGRKTIKSFDAAGNLASIVDSAERETTYSFDAAGRPASIDYSEEATPDASFEYDADGNVVAISDGTGESSFAYDQLGRLTSSEDGHGEAVEYSYDLSEQQTGLVYPNGKSVSRTYNAAGRLESITDWLGGTTNFGYDADSNLTAIAFPAESENVDEYAYDRGSRMSEATFKKGAETLASLSYVRDALGQVEKEARSGLPGSEEVSYGYDQNNRLIEAGAASFEYDAADNLKKGIGSTNTYDAASQLETGTGVSYSYDKLGERTKAAPATGPATSYGYDQAGNLISVARPEEGEVAAISENFAYDATGLLVSKTSGLTMQHLSWDASAQLPLLLADGENNYIYGPNDLPVEQISTGEEPTYLHHDQLGSTRMLTDAIGKTSASFSYTPYGGLEGKTGTATTPLGFAGQYTDAETGLQYLRARFYDPGTAQFLTRDAMVGLTRAPYAYAQANPLNLIDPSGHMCTTPIVVGGIQIGEVPDLFCSWQKGGEEVLESPYAGPAAGIACALNPECGLLEGLAAAGLLTTLSNLLQAEHDPCFNFWRNEMEGLLVLLGGAGPGGLFERFGGATPGLGATGRRVLEIIEDVPGIILDAVHSIGHGR